MSHYFMIWFDLMYGQTLVLQGTPNNLFQSTNFKAKSMVNLALRLWWSMMAHGCCRKSLMVSDINRLKLFPLEWVAGVGTWMKEQNCSDHDFLLLLLFNQCRYMRYIHLLLVRNNSETTFSETTFRIFNIFTF